MSLLIPSYKSGFARNAAESENPNLWDQLVGFWAPSLGPTGITLRDQSGYSNHGTLTTMDPETDWVISDSRMGGYVLDFDGANDHITLQKPITFTNPNVFTVIAYVRIPEPGGVVRYTIIGHENEANVFQLEVGAGPGDEDGNINIIIPGVFVAVSSNFNWPTLEWQQIVYSRSGTGAGKHAFYRNGRDAGVSTNGANNYVNGTTAARLGRRSAGSQMMPGQLSHVYAYDRVLALSEIQSLYRDSSALLRPRRRVFAAAAAAPPSGNPWYSYAQQVA